MILEFENLLFLLNIGLNLFFNNDVDFILLFDWVIFKIKKILVIFVVRKKSFLKKNEEENCEMFGWYFDDYDSYEDDFDSLDVLKECRWRYFGFLCFRYF